MEWILIITLLFIILSALYYFLMWNYDFWEKQGIPSAPGIVPLFGHMWSVLLLKESFPSLCEKLYKKYPNSSMVGLFKLKTPTLLIRDPEIVKTVLVSNFASFHDNEIKLDSRNDPSMSKTPFFAKGEVWKQNRAIMTNGFSNKKLKLLFTLTEEVSLKMNVYLNKMSTEKNFIEIDLLHFWTKYTGEFVAHVGFGVEGRCFDGSSVTFQTIIEPMFDFSTFGREKEMILFFIYRLARILKISRVPNDIECFLQKLVKDIIEDRKKEETVRNDFLQMMIDYQKSRNPDILDEKTLLVIMESFLLEAYESASIGLSFLSFYLACHPEIQEKVRKEVNAVLTKSGGQLDYEALKDLTYMEQVFNETSRLDPAVPILLKSCTKQCQLKGFDGLVCQVKPGNIIAIPLYGFYMDPKYWPNPEKFDPDRFSEDQTTTRSKFVFMPFGAGPRVCIGRKMAMIELKVAMVQILKNFSLELSEKTALPLKRSTSLSTYPKSGLWVKMKRL